MKNKIFKNLIDFSIRFLALIHIYPKRAGKNMFLPVVVGYSDTRKHWERIYKDYYDEDVDLSGISIPPLYSFEPHDLIFVCDISLSKAYKNFCEKRKFHDFYTYGFGKSNELGKWNTLDAVHVRNPNGGAYAIWVKKDFQKASDSFQKRDDIPHMKDVVRNHVTLLEHFLHLAYIFETSEYMPTPWRAGVICLGTTPLQDYHPEITFQPLRFGATLNIESVRFNKLYDVFKEQDWYEARSDPHKKNPYFHTLFSNVN